MQGQTQVKEGPKKGQIRVNVESPKGTMKGPSPKGAKEGPMVG